MPLARRILPARLHNFIVSEMRTACLRPIAVSALRLALVVGTLLKAINQGGPLLDGLSLPWAQVASNYLVPHGVSTYSAAGSELRRQGKAAA